MSLSSLLDDVQEITRRPDARARSLLALNSLILELTTNYDYPEDLVETTVANPVSPPEAYGVLSLDIAGYPKVRKIAYVTANDLPLQSITPRNALDAKGCEWVNSYYRSGNNLVVRASAPFPHIRLGYYQTWPALAEAPGLDTHWMLDSYYSLLLNGVLARTFQATGDDISAQYYEGTYRAMRRDIRAGISEGD